MKATIITDEAISILSEVPNGSTCFTHTSLTVLQMVSVRRGDVGFGPHGPGSPGSHFTSSELGTKPWFVPSLPPGIERDQVPSRAIKSFSDPPIISTMSAPSRAGVRLLTHVATRPCRVPRQLCPRLVFFRPVSSPASASEAPPPATASTTAANAKSSPSTFHNLAAGLSDQPATDDGLLDLGGSSSSPHDWTRSFHGLSVSPFTPEQAEILMQAIPDDDVEIKPDGIVYLPEIKYRRILNKAFGPGGWGMAPRGETLITDRLVTREYALVAGGRYGTPFIVLPSFPSSLH